MVHMESYSSHSSMIGLFSPHLMLQSAVQSDVQKVRSIKATLCLLLSASHCALMVCPHIGA